MATEARRTGAQLEKARKEAKHAKANAGKTPRKSSKLSEEDKEELNEVDEVEKDEMAELERRRRREERHRRRRSSAHTATIQAAVSLPSCPTTFLRRLDKNGLWRQLPVEDRAMQAIGLPVEHAWLLKYMVWLLGGLIFGRVLRALP